VKEENKKITKFIDVLNKSVLDHDYPIELVDEELREFGLDPDKVAKEGREFVEGLIKNIRKI